MSFIKKNNSESPFSTDEYSEGVHSYESQYIIGRGIS